MRIKDKMLFEIKFLLKPASRNYIVVPNVSITRRVAR